MDLPNTTESYREDEPRSPEKTEEGTGREGYDAVQRKIMRLLSAKSPEADRELAETIKENFDALNRALYVPERFAGALDILNFISGSESGKSEAQKAALLMIEANLPLIESHIRSMKSCERDEARNLTRGSDQAEINLACFRATYNLATFGEPTLRRLGAEMLSRHLDILEEAMAPFGGAWHAPFLETVANGGNREAANRAVQILENYLPNVYDPKSLDVKNCFMLQWFLTSGNYLLWEMALPPVLKYLQNVPGIDARKFLAAWQTGLPHLNFKFGDPQGLRENFANVEILEKLRPGSVAVLNREFGIFDFGRYPVEALLHQYHRRDNGELPYGIVFYPRFDHNGVFFGTESALANLFEQLRGKYELRVCEGENKIDIVKLLHRFKKKYGQKHKISFAVVGGHGTAENIRFGPFATPKHFLQIVDFFDVKHQIWKNAEFFEKNPTIILVSCSTGAEEGIGEKLASAMGAKVIAPKESTNVKRIKADIKKDKIDFSVEYCEPAAGRVVDARSGRPEK